MAGPATARVVLRGVGPFGAAVGGDDAPLLRGTGLSQEQNGQAFRPAGSRERHGLHPQLASGWTISREHRSCSSFSRIATLLLNRKTSPQ